MYVIGDRILLMTIYVSDRPSIITLEASKLDRWMYMPLERSVKASKSRSSLIWVERMNQSFSARLEIGWDGVGGRASLGKGHWII